MLYETYRMCTGGDTAIGLGSDICLVAIKLPLQLFTDKENATLDLI